MFQICIAVAWVAADLGVAKGKTCCEYIQHCRGPQGASNSRLSGVNCFALHELVQHEKRATAAQTDRCGSVNPGAAPRLPLRYSPAYGQPSLRDPAGMGGSPCKRSVAPLPPSSSDKQGIGSDLVAGEALLKLHVRPGRLVLFVPNLVAHGLCLWVRLQAELLVNLDNLGACRAILDAPRRLGVEAALQAHIRAYGAVIVVQPSSEAFLVFGKAGWGVLDPDVVHQLGLQAGMDSLRIADNEKV